MSFSFRSTLLICGALFASSITPAQAGPSSESDQAIEVASLPKVATPDLLNDGIEPVLSDPTATDDEPPGSDSADTAPAAPVLHASGDLSSMVSQLRASDPGSHELECLAVGIYYESKSEPLAGQLAVGQVIANRAKSGGRFPPSYCGVLFQRGQFSFVRGHSLPSVPRASKQWQTAVAVAKIVDGDLHESSVGKALFFHARYVSPGWRLKRVAAIGNHIFYR
jgi:N-acetylmuramoyl-L-alanine amidase